MTVPESVVETLPAAVPSLEETDWHVVERSLPDVPNKCRLLRPQPDIETAVGLLTLLARPDDESFEKIADQWRDHAIEHHFAVLVVGASGDDRWTPAESDTIIRLIQQTQTALPIADHRIAIGGFGAGAEMALMVAFRNREVIRGAVVQAGTRPGGFSLMENDPAKPIELLVVGGSEIPVWGRIIAKAGFPVALEKSQSKQPMNELPVVRDAIGRWIRSLERI